MVSNNILKYLFIKFEQPLSRFINIIANAGSRSSKLGDDMRIKLKAVYTLVEQLYTGAQRAISSALYKKPAPSLIKEVLEKLSVVAQMVE